MLPVSMQMYVTGVSYGYQLRMSVAGGHWGWPQPACSSATGVCYRVRTGYRSL